MGVKRGRAVRQWSQAGQADRAPLVRGAGLHLRDREVLGRRCAGLAVPSAVRWGALIVSDHDLVVCPCGSGRRLQCLYPKCRNGDAVFAFQEEWGRVLLIERHRRAELRAIQIRLGKGHREKIA
jgi:hypothetical protein